MNNPKGGRDSNKEIELMGEAGKMGRGKERDIGLQRYG